MPRRIPEGAENERPGSTMRLRPLVAAFPESRLM